MTLALVEGGENEPQCSVALQYLIFLWLAGVMLLGKTFCYLGISPLYVTELVLGLILFENRRRLMPADIVMLGVTGGFAVGGYWRWGEALMVGKDLAWLYYLLFLRFFPRNFSDELRQRLILIALLTVPLQVVSFLVDGMPGFEEKYRTVITYLFLLLVFMVRQKGRATLPQIAVAVAMGLLSDFKTSIVMPVVAVLLSRYDSWMRWRRLPMALFLMSVSFLIVIALNGSETILTLAVDALNALSSFASLGKTWATGTATWRAEIWTSAIDRTLRDGRFLFGELPGHNFLDWRFLGNLQLRDLGGGEELGIVRTPHNILVLIVVRTGIVGLAVFTYFYWRWVPKNKYAMILNACVIVCALTSDILEVPSRGPLLYCLSWLLTYELAAVQRRSSAGLTDHHVEGRSG